MAELIKYFDDPDLNQQFNEILIQGIGIGNFEIVWDALRIKASATRVNPATSKPDYDTFVGGTKTFVFDGGTNESVTFQAQLPHSYKRGTDIIPHIHWSPTDNNSGTVIWKLEYTWADIDESFPSTTIIQASSNIDTDSYKNLTTAFDKIDGENMKESSTIMCKLTRDASNDTYTSEAAFIEFNFHFLKNKIGTFTENPN